MQLDLKNLIYKFQTTNGDFEDWNFQKILEYFKEKVLDKLLTHVSQTSFYFFLN